ncbi:caspase-3-like [Ptychodera flava]|uniref:caspase-3-like n=1 Tax=Ptychodera flava TaxID=63121 RepID=UPI003969D5D3
MASDKQDISDKGDSVDAGILGKGDRKTVKASDKGVESSPGVMKFGEGSEPMAIDNSSANGAEDRYNMTYAKRGKAVIINNQKFKSLNERKGSDVDREKLKEMFKKLAFSVKIYNNLTCGELKDVLKALSEEDHSNSDCLAIAIQSHGADNGDIYGSDDETIPILQVAEYFLGDNCKSLVGKPKLFFIQACQGTKTDPGVDQVDAALDESHEPTQRLPVWADFLICLSTMHGYYAFRNSEKGSWFIQAMDEVFRRHAESMDLISMMTRVNRKVALEFESNVPRKPGYHKKKQIPCIMSMLTKEVYFTWKPPVEEVEEEENEELGEEQMNRAFDIIDQAMSPF